MLDRRTALCAPPRSEGRARGSAFRVLAAVLLDLVKYAALHDRVLFQHWRNGADTCASIYRFARKEIAARSRDNSQRQFTTITINCEVRQQTATISASAGHKPIASIANHKSIKCIFGTPYVNNT